MLPIEQGKDYDEIVKSQLPYKLLANLGVGGSGVVEMVEDRLTGKLFARKVIHIRPERRLKEGQAIVFRNEIKNIRRLGSHRHIISLFATYTTESEFGLILQPVASDKDLGQYLASYVNALPPGDSTPPDLRIHGMTTVLEQAFGCLINGMSYMHKRRVRHKDVKLQNILVHQGRVIYTDFGYSFDSNGYSRSVTYGTPKAMTAKYSAPEVLAHEARDSSSDIYSLGCVFINILSALTSATTPEIQEILSFADSMNDIHHNIVNWNTNLRTAPLPAIITQMTTLDPSARLCAVHIASKISDVPGLSCQECASHTIDPISECIKSKTCVKETHTPGEHSLLQATKGTIDSPKTLAVTPRLRYPSPHTKAEKSGPRIRMLSHIVPCSAELSTLQTEHALDAVNTTQNISPESATSSTTLMPSTTDKAEASAITQHNGTPPIVAHQTQTSSMNADSMGDWGLPCMSYTMVPILSPAEKPLRRVATFPTTQPYYRVIVLASTSQFPEPVTPIHRTMSNSLGLANTVQEAASAFSALNLPYTSLDVPQCFLAPNPEFRHYM